MRVIHVKMVVPAQTWKMGTPVNVKVDLLELSVKQVLGHFSVGNKSY